jgi:hypothetical protein
VLLYNVKGQTHEVRPCGWGGRRPCGAAERQQGGPPRLAAASKPAAAAPAAAAAACPGVAASSACSAIRLPARLPSPPPPQTPETPQGDYCQSLEKAEVVREGTDVSIFTYSRMRYVVMQVGFDRRFDRR